MGGATRGLYDASRLAEMRAWAVYYNIARLAAFIGILSAPFALWALFWTSPRDYPFLSSMLFVPLITYACVMLFSRVWKKDKFIKSLFGGGMAIRIAAAGAYVWLGFFVFGVAVDAFHYWTYGLVLAGRFSTIGWRAFGPPWTSTNLLCNLCGMITLVIGNAMPTLFVLFALAALWGAYFFYRAFCITYPEGDRGLYGVLLVLLPSIVYWSSAIGKDALEQFFIGLAAYGFARYLKEVRLIPAIVCLLGITGSALVRPHVGAMLALSMLVAYTIGKAKNGWLSVALKLVLVPVLAAGTVYMVSQAQTFVGVESSDFRSGVDRLKLQTQYTETGGSTFNHGESLTRRVMQGPFLVFRPFPWEVHNITAAIASVEGIGLLILTWRRRRQVWAFIRDWREAYPMFILIFGVQFSIIFSAATSNFGILVRERIMLVPMFLMLLCAKPVEHRVVRPFAVRRFRGWPRDPWPTLQTDRSV